MPLAGLGHPVTRILAFADTQLGVPTVDLDDQRQVLDRIVQVALEREVDAVLHGGDVFEGPVVTPEQLRTFIDAVRPLHEAGVPLLAIRGNGRHDMAVREVNALDVLREVAGIQICDSPSISVLADKLVVCALPWVHPGRLIAQSNGSLTHDEANLTTSQMLVKIAEHLHGKAALVSETLMSMPIVLLAHWAISGSALPTGLPVDEMREPILSWPDLDAIGYDAVVGAHVHEPQQISQPLIDQTLGIVVGSPQQLNHGEHGEHGCWIIEIDKGPDHESRLAEFVPVQSRQFITVDAFVVHSEEERRRWFEITDGAIVRVRYEATEDEARQMDHDAIRRELHDVGASRVTIEPQIIRKERARAQQINEQLGPLDALAAYCDSQDMPTALSLEMLKRLKEWSDG